jgi:hypothetical protein
MQDWILEEAALLKQEQEAFNVEGVVPFWNAPQGETKIEIDTTRPAFKGKFDNKKVFHIFVEGDLKLWTVSTKSPIYREVINNLVKGSKVFKLIRVGTDQKNTRYSLVVL